MDQTTIDLILTGPIAVYCLTELYKFVLRKIKKNYDEKLAKDMAATIVSISFAVLLGTIQYLTLPKLGDTAFLDFYLKAGTAWAGAALAYKLTKGISSKINGNKN